MNADPGQVNVCRNALFDTPNAACRELKRQ